VRHWICSFPWGLRALLGYDRNLARPGCLHKGLPTPWQA
jgi:hypothetical protein